MIMMMMIAVAVGCHNVNIIVGQSIITSGADVCKQGDNTINSIQVLKRLGVMTWVCISWAAMLCLHWQAVPTGD
jgi:hypothetical protein